MTVRSQATQSSHGELGLCYCDRGGEEGQRLLRHRVLGSDRQMGLRQVSDSPGNPFNVHYGTYAMILVMAVEPVKVNMFYTIVVAWVSE